MTKDYHERTSLNGYRFGFAVIGTILGAGAVLPLVGLMPDRRAGFSLVGLVFGLIMAVTAIITGLSVRERPHDGDRPQGFSRPMQWCSGTNHIWYCFFPTCSISAG
jgi:Na+/melibiose symporter-like transporter